MLTKEQATKRVARGAAHLDKVCPGWFTRIDVGTLTLANCYRCTLGQLFKEFSTGVTAIGLTFPLVSGSGWLSGHNVVRYGFAITAAEPEEEASYQRLQDAWIEAIADRCLHSQEAVKQPEADDAVAGNSRISTS